MSTRVARLDIRTTEDTKITIENAARYLGTTTSAFVLGAVMEKAISILQRAQAIELNEKEHKQFIKTLESPPKPHKNLQKLFDKYKDS